MSRIHDEGCIGEQQRLKKGLKTPLRPYRPVPPLFVPPFPFCFLRG